MLAEIDLANHYVLQPSQPDSVVLDSYVNRQYVDPGDDTTVDPHELINPAGGEDIDVEDLAGGDDDYVEPSETQKKEIFKMHRGLGHPLPNEFWTRLETCRYAKELYQMGGQRNEMPCV